MADLQRLLIVSHVRHYRHNGDLYAYTPYAREIDIWADLFPEVCISAPCVARAPASDCARFTRRNISMAPHKETGGPTLRAKLTQVAALPSIIWCLHRGMRRADAIHVRCPGNVAIPALLMAPLYSRYLVAKFAGQWRPFAGEAWSVRLQRQILRSPLWRGPVTVYGRDHEDPTKIISFFTSVLTREQIQRSQSMAPARRSGDPLRVLFVGRLSASKRVEVMIEAIAALRLEGIDVRGVIVGEGPQRSALEDLARATKVQDAVEFSGGLEFDQVLHLYAVSDALVLVSDTEGWPKVIAEAMAFGTLCIGSDRGFVREMLADGRGILVPPGDTAAVTSVLRELAQHPGRFESTRQRAAEWSRRYSLEDLREALGNLLRTEWGVPLKQPANSASGMVVSL